MLRELLQFVVAMEPLVSHVGGQHISAAAAAAAAAVIAAPAAAAIAAATAATATDVLTQFMPPLCCYHIQQKTLLIEPLRLHINTFNISNCSSSLWL